MSLLTDLYQITMSQGYFRAGIHERLAAFHLFFRREPFGGGYAVAAGLDTAIEWLTSLRIDRAEIEYLSGLTGNDDRRLFSDAFLQLVADTRFTLDIDAMPEGTLAFSNEPLVRVVGPLWQCQWVETALLNMINFQTLIASQATRVCRAAGDQPVLEFGLRRAQGVDGGLSASRAAYIGGCAATSNVQAGMRFGVPVKGTHAHSWVMAFEDEPTAFNAYADAMPNNCIFLVDTYDTLAGVQHAIAVGQRLRAVGHEMVGIRLDSGDMTSLSQAARKLLDQAGFPDASIVASNDLDERKINQMQRAGAKIDVWGVGTSLVTAKDDPALGGVYKLAAIQDEHGQWQAKVKLSEQSVKCSNPGIQQVRRFEGGGKYVGDVIFSELLGPPDAVDQPEGGSSSQDLLRPIVRHGRRLGDPESLQTIRQRVQDSLSRLPEPHQRFDQPAAYPVRLEGRLSEQKQALIDHADDRSADAPDGLGPVER
ncbi:nicotinate phosphoribosyltransferase [Roseiconus nitratireducens]|uniref:Nicotinate phosphoribosyltransferase n=1 Tax=Roseiconus nitratireducens TaxID=2605748 RepID=A0A5M6D5P8_9BACT|nr:nicotinate phosphoribosyltransferase [Roseiconus nitratireducens]KAA5541099.1 nicotinate phosphoribosyltransferase [Roseiconus nitratireducens]